MPVVVGYSRVGCGFPLSLYTYILIADSEHKVFALVEDLSYSRPVVVGHGRFIPQHNDAARSESQVVLYTVLAL